MAFHQAATADDGVTSFRLKAGEIALCEWVGKQRFHYAKHRCLDPGHGSSIGNVDAANHIRGAKAEFATSVMFNLFWRPAIGELNAIDVGDCLECKSIGDRNHSLIIKPDAKELPHCLIFVDANDVCEFIGWEHGRFAKDEVSLSAPAGRDEAHYVRNNFRPKQDLEEWIRRRFNR